MSTDPLILEWLLASDEPWTRYRTRLDLMDQEPESPEAIRDRREMISDQNVQDLILKVGSWPGYPLKRHNDAKHPIQGLTVLADIGIKTSDPGVDDVIKAILSHQSLEGAFETQIQLYKSFGGLEGSHWVWMGCDAPVLLYVLFSFGLGGHSAVKNARSHVLSLVRENGWPCSASPILGKFKGPGKREDPCPIATLQALKALSIDPDSRTSDEVQTGIQMILEHWRIRKEKKYYLFGMGTDFKKLKYPLIWYDILHVADVLSNFRDAVDTPEFQEIVQVILDQADDEGKYTASSMYMAWKGWSFADKKQPSPWLTFLVERVKKRAGL